MTAQNTNGWSPSVSGVPGKDSDGPVGSNGQRHFAYVNEGIRRSEGQSFWTNQYLSDLSSSQVIRHYAWAVASTAASSPNAAPNTRLQFRNFRSYALLSNGSYVLMASNDLAAGPASFGGWYRGFDPGNETTLPVTMGSTISQGRVETSNGGGSSLGSISYGTTVGPQNGARLYADYVYHWWPLSGYDKTVSTWTSNIVGTIVVWEGRLILHDTSGTDDRAKANIIAYTGADYYNMSNSAAYVGEAYHGRWKQVTNDWQTFSGSDIPAAVLQANPPPGFSL